MAIIDTVPEEEAEDIQERVDRLHERFPSVSPDRILQVLRNVGGHAGYAAAELRALSTDVIKSVDPEDSEHVATLLSNHMLFKQTCRSQFKKFDINRNGTLECSEVLALTEHLCNYLGLEHPGEKSLQSFFDASDTNQDGVLTEREFTKFFESFLRYAYFMQHRRLVGNWKFRSPEDNSSSEFSILLGKDYRLRYRSSRGCPGTPKSQMSQPRQEISGTLELKEGALQANLKHTLHDKLGAHESFFGIVRIRFAEGTTEKVVVSFKKDAQAGWGTDVTAKRRQTFDEERASRCNTPTVGAILRCSAPNGVAFRRSPEFLERTDTSLSEGDTVRVMERHLDTHWVRVAAGWLPTVDPRGVQLFEVEAQS